MELRHLRAFIAIAEAGSVRSASRTLHVVQPALSRTLAELEATLGVRLFERGRGMKLTREGEALIADARRVIDAASRAKEHAAAIARGDRGVLRLGSSPSAMFHPIVPLAIRAFRLAEPRVELAVREASSAELLERVRGGELDLALVRPDAKELVGLSITKLVDEPLVAVVAREHPLARARSVRLEALVDHPLLLPATRSGSGLTALLERLALERSLGFAVAARAGHVASLVHLAASGLGVAIAPSSARGVRAPHARFVPIVGLGTRLTLAIATAPDGATPLAAAFVKLARAERRALRAARRAPRVSDFRSRTSPPQNPP